MAYGSLGLTMMMPTRVPVLPVPDAALVPSMPKRPKISGTLMLVGAGLAALLLLRRR